MSGESNRPLIDGGCRLKAFFVRDFARHASEFFKSLEERAGFVSVNAGAVFGRFRRPSTALTLPDHRIAIDPCARLAISRFTVMDHIRAESPIPFEPSGRIAD